MDSKWVVKLELEPCCDLKMYFKFVFGMNQPFQYSLTYFSNMVYLVVSEFWSCHAIFGVTVGKKLLF